MHSLLKSYIIKHLMIFGQKSLTALYVFALQLETLCNLLLMLQVYIPNRSLQCLAIYSDQTCFSVNR